MSDYSFEHLEITKDVELMLNGIRKLSDEELAEYTSLMIKKEKFYKQEYLAHARIEASCRDEEDRRLNLKRCDKSRHIVSQDPDNPRYCRICETSQLEDPTYHD
jgi:hypothetical protein